MSADEDKSEGEKEPNAIVSVIQTITPDFIRQNFAIKFGLVLLVMALSIGLIGFVATQAITAETEDNVESEFLSDATSEADLVDQWLESNKLQIEIQSGKGDYDQVDPTETELELGPDAEADDDIHALHVLEETGEEGMRLFASSDGTFEQDQLLANVDEREWLIETGEFSNVLALDDDEVYISDTYVADNRELVAFISPTSSPDDNDRYLFAEFDVIDLQSSLRGNDPDGDVGFTQVVHNDSAGYHDDETQQHFVMMDARPDSEDILQPYATSEDTLEPLRLASEPGVITEMDADPDVIDEVYTVGYAPVEDKEWVVLVHGPRSEVFGFVDTLGTWGLLVTLFSVLLIGVTGAALGYSTSTSIDRLTRKTEEMREGNLEVNLHTSRVDNIGQLYEGFADMRDALKNQIEESERARKEAEVARAEAENMAEYLQEKAEEYSDIMQQVSAGDLTQRMQKDGEEESMDRIADEFNGMIEELEKTTGQLKSYVDEVEEAGSEVEQSASTVRQASEQVADSIQKISDDAYGQKERLEHVTETVDDVVTRLDEFAAEHDVDIDEPLEQMESISTDINEIADLSEETMAESQNVAGAAEEQAAELNEVSERANDLQRYAQPLRDILQRFETEAEHEFVFSVGPTGGAASPSSRADEEADE